MADSKNIEIDLSDNLGFAKAILFGEHSVVYGYPAIVCGIGVGATTVVSECLIPDSNRFCFEGIRENFEVNEREDSSLGRAFLELFKVLKLDPCFNLHTVLSIPTGAGLGSSAAIGVSVARALISHFSLSPGKLAPAVEAFERVFHSSPSGVDQAAATSGGIFAYSKSRGIEKIKNPEMHLVIANVGSRAPTHEIVKDVAVQRDKDRARFQTYLSEMGDIANSGISALAANDILEVGRLMNHNHGLLKSLTVSSKALDEACGLAISKGALGAKLTGAGRGGCLIALVKEEDVAVQEALTSAGYWTKRCLIPETMEQ